MQAQTGSEPDEVVRRLRAAGCVFAEDEAALLRAEADSAAQLDAWVAHRAEGRPIEHVLGWASFCGLRIDVAPGVFVPRHRTELLVERAARLVAVPDDVPGPGPDAPGPVVVDLCCGAGALGLAVVHLLRAGGHRGVRLHAADIDPAAVACARRNLEPVGGRVHLGDLFAALPSDLRGHVDLLLANVPYVPTDEIRFMPIEARGYEPAVALDGGPDGLVVLRRVADDAARWLRPGGHVLVEVSSRQVASARTAARRAGLRVEIVSTEDATVLIGTRRSSAPGTAATDNNPGMRKP